MLFPFHKEQHNLHKPKHTTGIYLPVLLQFINIAEKPLYRTTPTLKGGSYPAYIQNLSLSKTKSIYLNTPCTNALTRSKPNSLIAKPNIKICPKNKQESSPQNRPFLSPKTAHFPPSKQTTPSPQSKPLPSHKTAPLSPQSCTAPSLSSGKIESLEVKIVPVKFCICRSNISELGMQITLVVFFKPSFKRFSQFQSVFPLHQPRTFFF